MFEDIFTLILKAEKTLKGQTNITPIFTASYLGEGIFIKMENLQRTGSFKYRGAYNKIHNLSDEEKKKGVVASSAGNHAQGVAKSASSQKIQSTIFIPSVAPIAKIEATRRYGAEVKIVDGVYDDAYKAAKKFSDDNDKTFIHPFDDKYVIAGQGTIGLEILDQLPDVERIIVPVGGGGLISGIAIAVKTLKPDVEIIGVEPESAASMKKSLEKNELTQIDITPSIADGIAVKKPGELTFSIIKELVDSIVTVSDGEIAGAILNMLEKSKIVSEGAGAASIAALDKFNDGKLTCCLLSGGNINVNMISRIIQKGLYESGRQAEITTMLPDKPGELIKFLDIFSKMEANILTVNQFVEHEKNQIGSFIVRVVLETKNFDQIDEIHKLLRKRGYDYIKI